jgi:L-alanine-DL-glutamate epimerase-like enolase superfamily enzyme
VTGAKINRVEGAAYQIPTDSPEGDGTQAWDSTGLVVATVTVADVTGMGFSYAAPAAAAVINDRLAGVLTGRDPMEIPALNEAMVRQVRNDGRPGVAATAVSAVDIALWDLKARLVGLPLTGLLGRAHPEVPVYGSGGFTTYDEQQTSEQLGHWVGELEIPRVKIKIGESWGTDPARDLDRVRLARRVIGEEADLFVDANGAYSAKQAVRIAHRMMDDARVTWFEEPVSSDDHTGLRQVRMMTECDVAAGEYGYHPNYFAALIADEAVDCVQIDVTRVGGITAWLAVAHLAAAHNLEVSGHCAPNLHAHVAGSATNLRHVEYFWDHERIEDRYFEGALVPHGGALVPGDAPGHGLAFKTADLEDRRVA